MSVGSGPGTAVYVQTWVTANDGPAWMIHIPGLSLKYGDPNAGGAVLVGQEQHLAVVKNGPAYHNFDLYVDGVLVPMINVFTDAGPAAITLGAGMTIGASDGATRGLDGVVGAARIFEFEAGTFNINDTLIPEPASLALLGLGGLLMLRRRRA